jgi:hypothetical protein
MRGHIVKFAQGTLYQPSSEESQQIDDRPERFGWIERSSVEACAN